MGPFFFELFNMDYSYIGWVPCVSGRLFYEFTHLGLGESPACHINYVEKDTKSDLHHRYIIISSVVDWKDGKDRESVGKYSVYMIAHKTSEETDLKGVVCICGEDVSTNDIKKLEDQVREIKQHTVTGENITTLFSELETAVADINNDRFYKVNFLIESLGFVKLSYDSGKIEGYTENHKYTVCRQAYYYVKYSLHRHTHHHDKAESLTTIHPLDIEKNQIGVRLINDIRKSLVQLKKDFEPYNCNNVYHASGIVSYAKSLVESCHKEDYVSDDEYKSEMIYFDNVKSSLEVMSDVVEKEISKNTMISGNARAIILFALSIIMPLVLVFKDKIVTDDQAPNFIVTTFGQIISSDTRILVTGLVLFVFYHIYKSNALNHGSMLLTLKFYRDFLEKIVYEKIRASFVLSISVVMCFSLILYSMWSILNS